MEGWQTLNQN